MTQAPLHWIKQIEHTAIDTQAIPLSGYPPAFPWEEFSKKVAELFQTSDLKIQATQVTTLSGEAIGQGFGPQSLALELNLTPLEGRVFFLMGKEEVGQLTALALTTSHTNKGFLSASFQEGFYSYLCTRAVLAINDLDGLGDLALKLGKPASLPQEEALCIDLEIHHPKHTFFARIVCPAPVHKAFKERFREKQPPSLSSSLARETEITTRISIGQTQLSAASWKRVHTGDLILLDRCSFDPHTRKGTAFLCLGETPILRLRFKEDHLKIVNYATYHEEQQSMDPNTSEPEENEEFSSPDLDENVNGDHLWSPETTKHDAEEEGIISTSQIPITIVVEVGRVKMNLEELLNLAPGNTIELPVRPEQGVDLTIQGKKVAKAELIKLGEMLGVKILKLAP